MDTRDLTAQKADKALCMMGQEQRRSGCRGWLQRRCMRAVENRKRRAELHQKVLEALASCPPSQELTYLSLHVRYNRSCGRWETMSVFWERRYQDLESLAAMMAGYGTFAIFLMAYLWLH